MTPLEELQAAHKRLSELKNRTSYGPWVNHSGEIVTSDQFLVATFGDFDEADLAVTLHRTIDAQLAILNDAIADSQIIGIGTTNANPTTSEKISVVYTALPLARAINGEAS